MKKYNITVNGKTYEVDVEEIGGVPSVAAIAPAPVAAASPVAAALSPASAPAAAPVPAAAAPTSVPSAGATVIESPMPGTILDVLVKVGDVVKEDQILLVLEAMKMENEIVATSAGTVDSIAVSKGAAVNSGDVLISIK